MRSHASVTSPLAPCKLGLWAATVLVACVLEAAGSAANADDETHQRLHLDNDDDNLQIADAIKRDWDKSLKMWGKRGWGQLAGDWGKRKRSIPTAEWNDDDLTIPVVQKRTWQRLHGGWGKRSNDDTDLQDVAAILEQQQQQQQQQQQEIPDYDLFVEEKRKWKPFNEGWGKRNNKWDSFRGSWGKRDPTWVNLKGMWGKRSESD